MEMCKRLEEAKLKEETRWKEKLMRKRPVWQSLAYSQEEDLAMRLQLRKDEERLRNEEHKHRMQLMYGRVNQQPTLFERQSKVRSSSFFVSPALIFPMQHAGDVKTRMQLLDCLYKELEYPESVSETSSEKKLVAEMKDEGIQALDEEIDRYLKRKGGSSESEKERCKEEGEIETDEDDGDDEEE